MSDLDKILWTSATTILVGLIIFLITQIFQRFILDPLQGIHLLFGEIEDALVFYANIYLDPGVDESELADEGQIKLRRLASQLSSKASIIWPYELLASLNFIPSHENIKIAHGDLIGLSNSIHLGSGESGTTQAVRNNNMRKEIRKTLGIDSLD
jgi:hypothetical protein